MQEIIDQMDRQIAILSEQLARLKSARVVLLGGEVIEVKKITEPAELREFGRTQGIPDELMESVESVEILPTREIASSATGEPVVASKGPDEGNVAGGHESPTTRKPLRLATGPRNRYAATNPDPWILFQTLRTVATDGPQGSKEIARRIGVSAWIVRANAIMQPGLFQHTEPDNFKSPYQLTEQGQAMWGGYGRSRTRRPSLSAQRWRNRPLCRLWGRRTHSRTHPPRSARPCERVPGGSAANAA